MRLKKKERRSEESTQKMSLAALSSLHLPPFFASANTTNPRRKRSPSKPTPKSRRPPLLSSSTVAGGGEATTYTSLPPRDDFPVPSLPGISPQNPSEIKLRESPVPGLDLIEGKRGRRGNGRGIGGKADGGISLEEFDEFQLGFGSLGDVSGGRRGNEGKDSNGVGTSGKKASRSPGRKKGFGKNREFEDNGVSYTEDAGEFDFESDDEGEGEDEVILGYDSGDMEEDEFESEFDDEDDDFEGFVEGEDEFDEVKVKEKGIPAVMRCFDRAKIYVKAGNGGNGVVAFRREKFVPLGGPSGGDGGRGGNVYVEVDGAMNSLLPFRKSVHFRAGRGGHGHGAKQAGAKGVDVVVKVPPGTVVREGMKEGMAGEVLLELMEPGQRALLLPGGRGGRGNASFKSGTNKVPKIAENGEEGPEMWLDLELKLVADVGIVGAPNAGKSTLLSAISAAQPAIADYPFTTLLPNLGVVSLDFDATMVVADLPGLLEGAHRGFGLGHEFLRHSERCSVLVHVVDGSSQQPEYEFDAVRLELELFSPELAEKPFIVVFNKMDIPDAYEQWVSFKEHLQSRGIQPFGISALNRQGTQDIVSAAYELLRKERDTKNEIKERIHSINLDHVADTIKRQRSSSMGEFEVFHDSSSNAWHVVGAGIERFVQMTNWKYSESLKRFQHALEACGVNKSLTKRGVKEGDTVIVGGMEMIWNDENQKFNTSSATRLETGL